MQIWKKNETRLFEQVYIDYLFTKILTLQGKIKRLNPLFGDKFRKSYAHFVQLLYKHKSRDTNDNSKKRILQFVCFSKMYTLGHFVNSLGFIWLFVHITAKGQLILKKKMPQQSTSTIFGPLMVFVVARKLSWQQA